MHENMYHYAVECPDCGNLTIIASEKQLKLGETTTADCRTCYEEKGGMERVRRE